MFQEKLELAKQYAHGIFKNGHSHPTITKNHNKNVLIIDYIIIFQNRLVIKN
jgi:hypothetical protein